VRPEGSFVSRGVDTQAEGARSSQTASAAARSPGVRDHEHTRVAVVQRCTCRECRPGWSGGVFVLVEDTAEAVVPVDVQPGEVVWVGDRFVVSRTRRGARCR
jgi:hypothetical protein